MQVDGHGVAALLVLGHDGVGHCGRVMPSERFTKHEERLRRILGVGSHEGLQEEESVYVGAQHSNIRTIVGKREEIATLVQ